MNSANVNVNRPTIVVWRDVIFPDIFTDCLQSARHTLSLRSQDTIKLSGTRLAFFRPRAARNAGFHMFARGVHGTG